MIGVLLLALLVGATGPAIPAATQGNGDIASGTVAITFLACEDGTDPNETPEDCTEPVAAPEDALLGAPPDFVLPLDEFATGETGVYLLKDIPGFSYGLGGVTPADYNYLTIIGGDEESENPGSDATDFDPGWSAPINLRDGETREITVYYWNGRDGLIEPAESTLRLTLAGCAPGIDPAEDLAACTEPVEAPEEMGVYAGRVIHVRDLEPETDGSYLIGNIPPYHMVGPFNLTSPAYAQFLITGDVDETDEFGSTTYVTRGEDLEITVAYFGGAPEPDEPGGTATPVSDEATIRVTLLSCPEGVEPRDDPDQCLTPLDDDGTATLNGPDGTVTTLTDLPRDGDAYSLADAPPGDYRLTGTRSDIQESHIVGIDEIEGADNGTFVISVATGETRDVVVYYYDYESTVPS